MTSEEVAVALAEHGKEIGSLKHRMHTQEENSKTIQDLALSIRDLAHSIIDIAKAQDEDRKKQAEDAARISELELEPLKKWKQIYMYIVCTVIGCIITTVVSIAVQILS